MQTEIIDNDRKTIGNATFQQGSGGVLMYIEVEGLPPGFDGMHFHEVGDCSDRHEFERAGDHIDPHQIIHAERDDHTSQPIGNSGPRTACGVIKR